MKEYTSNFLKAVALVYMAFPASYLFFVALLFDIPAASVVRMLLSPSYYLLSGVAIAAGYGLWEMRRWSWYIFITANVLIAYTSAVVVADFGETYYKFIAYMLSLIIVGALVYRVGREVRVPYFLPRIRWWESNPRYRFSISSRIERDNGDLLEGEILDLSLQGCFVKLPENLRNGEFVKLQFELYGERIEVSGAVVWRTESSITHPKGLGIKFGPLPRMERRTLRAMVNRIKKISALYRSSRYLMSAEEFSRKLDEMESARLPIYRPNAESGPNEDGNGEDGNGEDGNERMEKKTDD